MMQGHCSATGRVGIDCGNMIAVVGIVGNLTWADGRHTVQQIHHTVRYSVQDNKAVDSVYAFVVACTVVLVVVVVVLVVLRGGAGGIVETRGKDVVEVGDDFGSDESQLAARHTGSKIADSDPVAGVVDDDIAAERHFLCFGMEHSHKTDWGLPFPPTLASGRLPLRSQVFCNITFFVKGRR